MSVEGGGRCYGLYRDVLIVASCWKFVGHTRRVRSSGALFVFSLSPPSCPTWLHILTASSSYKVSGIFLHHLQVSPVMDLFVLRLRQIRHVWYLVALLKKNLGQCCEQQLNHRLVRTGIQLVRTSYVLVDLYQSTHISIWFFVSFSFSRVLAAPSVLCRPFLFRI